MCILPEKDTLVKEIHVFSAIKEMPGKGTERVAKAECIC